MIKLSRRELDALEQAEHKATHDAHLFHWGRSIENGWFMPQHHECAAINIRHQTCKSLCEKGLFEYRTIDYVQTHGKWRTINEYHISEAGIEYLKQLEGNKIIVSES